MFWDDPPPPPPPPPPPSIVVDAKDDLGQPVTTATVFVDDQPVRYELDGRPIELPAGPHTIAVQRNDGPRLRATEMVTLAEGDAGHAIHIVFPKASPRAAEELPTSQPLAPRIVVGVGLVAVVTGTVLILARPDLAPNCSRASCTRLPEESDATYKDDRSTAATNRDLTTAGVATVIAGAGIAASGLVWYFLERPPHRTATAATVTPWLAAESGGVTVRGAF